MYIVMNDLQESPVASTAVTSARGLRAAAHFDGIKFGELERAEIHSEPFFVELLVG
jgi:hypothetical protein